MRELLLRCRVALILSANISGAGVSRLVIMAEVISIDGVCMTGIITLSMWVPFRTFVKT